MNILFIKHFFLKDLWILRYRECPYSVTFPYIYYTIFFPDILNIFVIIYLLYIANTVTYMIQ